MKAMITNSIKTAEALMSCEWDGARQQSEGFAVLERAYDDYASGLFRYARALLGSADDAEDAVQEVFTRLARDVDKLRRVDDLRNYLIRATRNAAYEAFRSRRKREKLVEAEGKSLLCRGITEDDPKVEMVLEAFKCLPVEQREVLALKVFQGLTFSEIGKVIGKSQNTAASRYRYAIDRIREAVGEE